MVAGADRYHTMQLQEARPWLIPCHLSRDPVGRKRVEGEGEVGVGDLEGPTRKPRHASMFSTHATLRHPSRSRISLHVSRHGLLDTVSPLRGHLNSVECCRGGSELPDTIPGHGYETHGRIFQGILTTCACLKRTDTTAVYQYLKKPLKCKFFF